MHAHTHIKKKKKKREARLSPIRARVPGVGLFVRIVLSLTYRAYRVKPTRGYVRACPDGAPRLPECPVV
eukprot:4579283-Prymnesium_polylepis.1